jgi:YjbE family integral membrane protein
MDFLFNIHWAAVLKIIGIDILLGGDNAVVIAMACAAIPLANRNKAILGGTAAAILLRVIVLAFASYLVLFPAIKVLCGALLFWIGYKLVASEDDGDPQVNADTKVWGAIKNIAIADLVMSIDNVFAVTGASQSAGEASVYYAIVGVLFSIPFIVFGASMLSRIIDKFPIIIWIGAALIGWVGAEMILGVPVVHELVGIGSELAIELCGVLLVVIPGLYKTKFVNQAADAA